MDARCFDETGRFRTELRPHRPAAPARPVAPTGAVVPIVAGNLDHGRLVAFRSERSLRRRRRPRARAGRHGRRAGDHQGARGRRGRGASTAATSCATCSAGRAERRRAVAVAHCASLGWDVDRPLVVVVAELDPAAARRRRAAGWSGGRCRSGSPRPGRPSYAAARPHGAGRRASATRSWPLLGVPADGDVGAAGRATSSRSRPATAAAGGARSRPGSAASVDGRRASSRAAYEQARKAVQVGRQTARARAPSRTSTSSGCSGCSSLVADSAELRGFVDETLGELADARRRRGGRPAAHPAGAAGDQPQRRRDRAAAALPLQHAALPHRQARADARARSPPTRTCGSTSPGPPGGRRCAASSPVCPNAAQPYCRRGWQISPTPAGVPAHGTASGSTSSTLTHCPADPRRVPAERGRRTRRALTRRSRTWPFGWKLHGDGKTLAPGEVVAPTSGCRWGKTVGLGAQHVVAMFGATFVFPLDHGARTRSSRS